MGKTVRRSPVRACVRSRSTQVEKPLKARYLKFKREGPQDPDDVCPACGGLTDFSNGFLACSECNWNNYGAHALDFAA